MYFKGEFSFYSFSSSLWPTNNHALSLWQLFNFEIRYQKWHSQSMQRLPRHRARKPCTSQMKSIMIRPWYSVARASLITKETQVAGKKQFSETRVEKWTLNTTSIATKCSWLLFIDIKLPNVSSWEQLTIFDPNNTLEPFSFMHESCDIITNFFLILTLQTRATENQLGLALLTDITTKDQ